MSETKTQGKESGSSAKAPAEKSGAGKSSSSTSADTSSSNSGGNAGSAGKSASERSISHFSSVSTPAYKAGWDSIFGGSKAKGKKAAKRGKDDEYPDRLTIEDQDLDEELRTALYKAFQKKARKQGISLAKIKKRVEFTYTLTCDIEEK